MAQPRMPTVSDPPASLLGALRALAYQSADAERERMFYVSPGARFVTGVPAEAFLNGTVLLRDLVHPDDRLGVREVLHRAFAQGTPYSLGYRLVGVDGSTRWVRDEGTARRDPSDGSLQLEGVMFDVTELEESRCLLIDEQRRFAAAQRLARVGLWTMDYHTGESTISEEIYRIFGTRPDGRTFREQLMERLQPADQQRVLTTIDHVIATRPPTTQGEWAIHRADGTVRTVYNMTEWDYDVEGMLLRGRGIMQDITERVEMERQLKQSELRFRSLVDASAKVVWHVDARGFALDDMQQFRDFTGVVGRKDAPAREQWLEATHPDDRAALNAVLDAAVRRVEPFDVTHRLRRTDGEWRLVAGRGVPVRGEHGELREWVGTLTDITDYVRAQEAIRLAEARQVALLQSIPESAWLKALDGRYVTVNAAYAQSVGKTRPDELVGLSAYDFFPHDAVKRFEEEEQQVLAAGTPMTFTTTVELNGPETRVLETTIAPYRDSEGRLAGTVGVARDVTARRQLELRLRQAQKLEALGLLAGGIAHDFNNLLSAMLGGAELARMEVLDDSPAATDLDEVRRAAMRAAQLTRQLLTFSRQQVVQTRAIDLQELVRSAEPLLRRLVPDNVVLELVEGSPAVLRCDPSQLEQVLVNLVVNARDAIRDRRRSGLDLTRTDIVSVEVSRVTLSQGDARLVARDGTTRAAGAYVRLAVRDSGVGMSAETRARIFDPFFTTKRAGEGTGLGLATIAGVVAQRNGTVHVESEPGKGTTFEVLLPASDDTPEVLTVASAALPKGSETILLVEDEQVVRTTARRLLQRSGYTVLEARHGEDALLLWREHAADIDLVITDLRMPELGGRQFVARIHAERADVPVVFMSGYADAEELPSQEELSHSVFLPKPFTSESLLVSVRDALDGGTGIHRTGSHRIIESMD